MTRSFSTALRPLSTSTRRLALAVYALATPLAFPHQMPSGGVIDLGLVFAWLIPAALVIGIAGQSVRDAGRSVFFASLVGHALLFHWFFVVTVFYGGLPWWLGVFSPLVPALYVSVFSALFAMGLAGLRSSGIWFVMSGAALWVSLDWLRAHFLGGFPWATLGYALHLDIPLLALTRWTGVYGLSFLAAAGGLALAGVFRARSREAFRVLGYVLFFIALAHAPGSMSSIATDGDMLSIRIAAVQGNIEQGQKWDEARRSLILEKYLALSESAVELGAEWIVWPETALPGLVEWDPVLSGRLEDFSRRHGVALIVGGMGATLGSQGRRVAAFFDSAFVFDRSGDLVDRYDKTKLVPFGEFVPFRALLGRFFEALATGLSSSDVTAGANPRLLRWRDPARDGRPIRVAVPICYELLFPDVVSGFGAAGADILLAITNDAWYGRTGAPHQFLAMTVMRAAENGRWMVRAANTGVSAIIDDRGRVLDHSSLFVDALIVGDVPLRTSLPPTFYARFGDVFAAICGLVVLGALGREWVGSRRRWNRAEAKIRVEGGRGG